MERLLSRQRARVVLAVLIVGALIFGGGSSAIAQEDAATDQRVVRLLGTYEIQPDLGQVNVVEEITVSNVKGSQRSGDTVTTFFWTGHEIWLPSDAENVAIEVEGEPLEWEVFDTVSGVDIIAANYRRNLNFGQTRVIDVTYTLPTYGPGLGDRRINAAFFELEVLICCNFEEIDLTVTAPASFDVTPPLNLQFESAVAGSNQVFTYTDNEVTGEFTEVIFTDWVGIDDAGLEGTSATVGSDALLISYPPDDEEWSTDVSGFVEEAGATLEGLLGSPWPIDNFTLRQGPNRSFGPWGVTGPFDQPVTLPRDYGRQGLAATMVQAWLSDGPFDDEVIRNGLAYDLATEVVSLSGGREVTPLPPSGAGALDAEDSLWVMRQVSDEIGHDGLGMIVQMANNSETAYVGSGPAETVATIPGDWRRFIDLAEQRLDSQNVVGVFEEYVLQREQLTQLEERSSTLATYESLEADADGVVPLGIRTAMTNWDFAQANTLLRAAQEVVTERDRVIGDDPERAADAGLAFGETWANAESVEDLEAVRTSVLDRESELNGGLLQILLYALIGLIVLGGLAAAAFFFSRRKKSKSTPSGPSTPSNPTGGPVAEAASATVAAWPAPQEGWSAPGQQPQPQPGQQTVSAPAPQSGVSPPAGTPPPGSATMPGTPPAGPPPGGPPPGGPPPYAPPPTS